MHAKFKDDQTNITKYRQENPNEVFDLVSDFARISNAQCFLYAIDRCILSHSMQLTQNGNGIVAMKSQCKVFSNCKFKTGFLSSDQLAKMTCEDAYNWYNKPAAYCSYVGQRFDLEG